MKISTKLLAILLCVCFSLLIFANNIFANENSLVTVNADIV